MTGQKVLVHTRLARVLHWLIALGLVFLVVSGLYIHNPFTSGRYINMRTAQLTQISAGFIVMGLFAVRVYYGIITGDYKNILFSRTDIKPFMGLMKYYFFLEKKQPPHGKYNAGQKLIYTSWVLFFTFQIFSGLVLYYPVWANNSPFIGSLQTTRFYHYLVSLWFLATMPIHVYLVLTSDPGRLQAIFTGWTRIAPKKQ